MIHYYFEVPLDKEVVFDNDYEFATTHTLADNSPELVKVLAEFEGVYPEGPIGCYTSKFGGLGIHLDKISSGCKTILNIVHDQSKVYSLVECGDNAINYIYNLPFDFSIYAPAVLGDIEKYDVPAICYTRHGVSEPMLLCKINDYFWKEYDEYDTRCFQNSR